MEILEIDDREVVVTSTETKAPAGCLAAANLKYDTVQDILPELHETHQRYFGDVVACIDGDSPYRSVRVEFTANELSAEKMYNILSELIVQANALHAQRMIERSKRAHPSSGFSLSVVTDDNENNKPKRSKKTSMRATPRNRLRR